MPLKNLKHETYCHSIIKNEGNAKAAMEEAGLKYSQPFASQLKNNTKIQARLLELQRSAVSDKVATLTERLECLSEFARDVTNSTQVRMQALRELHNQSGDNVSKVDVDLNATTENIIRYVEIGLPAINVDNKGELETGDEGQDNMALEGIDKFLEDDHLEGDGSSTLEDDLEGDLNDDVDEVSSSYDVDDDF